MRREIIIQAEAWKWHWNNYPNERGWLRRVKNELDNYPRKTQADTIKQLAENKSTGIVRGTWDMFYMVEPMIWFEAKADGGSLSDDQKAFRDRGKKLGWTFFTFFSLEEFKQIMYDLH